MTRRVRPRTAALTVLTLLLTLLVVTPNPASGTVSTVSSDTARDSWDSHEPHLGPADVTSSDFGQLFSTAVNGQVYGQPLVLDDSGSDGVVIVTTENDYVYGLDARTGAILWNRSVGPAWPASAITCGDLTPNIGSTSAAVYSPDTKSVYFTAKVNDGPDVDHPHYYMHAIDPVTGDERSGWPVTIAGAPSNDPSTPFDPKVELQRSGLLLLDGVVYAGFGSHCDHGDYRGYVAGVSTASHSMTSLWATEVGPASQGSGIWHAGGGLMSDGSGRIFAATGNGVTPPIGPGASPPGTLSESVVRLQVNSDNSLTAKDFFAPADANTLDLNDTDLASGGPVALPDAFGTAAHPHVLIQQGKDGRIFLLDRDNLGGRAQGPGGGDAALNVVGPYAGQWGHPAAWSGEGGYVYMVGNGGPLRAFKSGSTGNGMPALTPAGSSSDTFPYTSGSPVISSDGTTEGSAVVWVVWSNGPTGGDAQLRAYSAEPDAQGNLPLLYSAPIGTAVKFTVPATDNGRVFVGTRDGHVLGFGRPAQSIMTGSPVDFGSNATGTTTTKTLTLTATADLTVTKVSTTSPFSFQSQPAFPLALKKNDQIQIPVTFQPGAPGAVGGIATITTDKGTIGFSLHGIATQPGLAASPPAVTFGEGTVGGSATVNVQITNTGTTDATITNVSAFPSGSPFSAANLPSGTIPAQHSVVVPVTYRPAAAGQSSTALTIDSTSAEGQNRLTIPVSGTAVNGKGHLTVNPTSVDFGTVALNSSRTVTFDLTNTGSLPLTVSLAKAPASDFTAATPLAEGTIIGPGQVVHQQVTFRPTKLGAETDRYQFNGDDGQGVINVNLTGAGGGALSWPNTTDWSVNGAATINAAGKSVQLTPNARSEAGTYLYRVPVPTGGLHATFTATFGPGGGGNGMTFAMLDPGSTTPASVGSGGQGLGFRGLRGMAVTLVPGRDDQARLSNFVGVAVGGNPLRYVATAHLPTSLRKGAHAVSIHLDGGHIQVWVDGKKQIDTVPPNGALPSTALVGWTASTGSGSSEAHTVTKPWVKVWTPAGQPLTANPASVDFRETNVSTTASTPLVLTNHGTKDEKITAVVAPKAPFAGQFPAVGTVVKAGKSITIPMTYRPTKDGPSVDLMSITSTSGKIVIPLNGTGRNTLPDLTTSSWSYSGLTTLSGTTVTLTADGQHSGAGLIVNSIPVAPKGVDVRFTAQIGGSGATGADGLTVALLDASKGKPTAPGAPGGGLGVAGLTGIFAALDTYPNGSVNSYNFAAVGKTSAGASRPTFLGTSTAIPPLRSGTHAVEVTINGASHMVVQIDSSIVLDVPVKLPPKVFVGFTAGVGDSTDTHAVINPIVTYVS